MTNRNNERVCYKITITGIVQGVGFRPFVYNLAVSLGVKGWVNNEGASVVIESEGPRNVLDVFVERLKDEAPPLSKIKNISVNKNIFAGYSEFRIKESSRINSKSIYISPDVSICEDCRRELFDKSNRRFLYPFINCTNCGPRFTIIKNVPYDRINTTMGRFPMCENCAEEYGNPSDRRYHAQPVACYACGPKLELLDREGNKAVVPDIVEHTCNLLLAGKIIAVKGLGGYHLACDALNAQAVKELRRRKVRDDKSFALMVRDYETAAIFCHINEEEKKLLESEKKPIVLLKRKLNIYLPEEIAPGNPTLGIMLPYTPVHLMLLSKKEDGSNRLSTLVMTSGNRSSEPIYYKDNEAMENLRDIADYFLTNDREIFIRTDDSVTRVFRSKEFIVRRSRGYVPMPVTCDVGLEKIPSILACGGELKNTFCLNKDNDFYLSHHIGDLENMETLASFEEGIEHFKKIFNIKTEVVAYDLHPEYLSTKYAMELDSGKKIAVQHHHAHIASCMAENDINDDVIGVAFDGTGYGKDGHIWGGEFFIGNYSDFQRIGHLEYLKMPGGEAAIKEPWRMAVSYLNSAIGTFSGVDDNAKGFSIDKFNFLEDIDSSRISAVLLMLQKNINCPLTSSMGRLFDAVSALIGVRSRINYEGQAAIELEYVAENGFFGKYNFEIVKENGIFIICLSGIIKGIIDDMKMGLGKPVIAAKFHETVADMVCRMCIYIRESSDLEKVVLSGGVFQNTTLLEKCLIRLEEEGFNTYIHSKVPSNDGGLALGQAAIAAAKLFGTK